MSTISKLATNLQDEIFRASRTGVGEDLVEPYTMALGHFGMNTAGIDKHEFHDYKIVLMTSYLVSLIRSKRLTGVVVTLVELILDEQFTPD